VGGTGSPADGGGGVEEGEEGYGDEDGAHDSIGPIEEKETNHQDQSVREEDHEEVTGGGKGKERDFLREAGKMPSTKGQPLISIHLYLLYLHLTPCLVCCV